MKGSWLTPDGILKKIFSVFYIEIFERFIKCDKLCPECV